MADVTERMLRLLATLQAGRPFGGEELATRLGVSPRTLRRDVERLRSYGYPVETRPGPGGRYLLAAGQRMPPLVLDDEEAVATIVGLATLASATRPQRGGLDAAAGRAYGKIDVLLPSRLRPRMAALRESIEAEHRPAPDVATDMLGEIAEAIAGDEVIVFDYIDAHGARSRRRAEAHRQVHIDRRWHVFCWDLDRDDWRVFRTDRITDLRRTGSRFVPRALPAGSAIAYLRSGSGEEFETVRIIVDAALSAVADALRHEDADLEVGADGRTRATVAMDAWPRLLAPLAHLEAEFQIEAPPAMSAVLRVFAQRLLAAA